MPKRAVSFVATTRPEQALVFYRDVLGLELLEDTPFALVFDALGTHLRIQKVADLVLAPYTAFGLEVEDIEAEVRGLLGRGVQPVRYPHFEQDTLGIWRAPGGAKVVWFKDPDGNLLSFNQS